MTTTLIVSVILTYFLVLYIISYFTSRGAGNEAFFRGERKSKWYLVSFGMIGASLSGVTFISIPGWVGDAGSYLVIAFVLLPLYYRLNVTSIYEYLEHRFGYWSYKTGAFFFLLSRVIGASVRLLLVANVLQSVLFDSWNIPFEVTVMVSVLLIWVYTNRGGIKTIVWTDTLQTAFMLVSVILTVWFLKDAIAVDESVVSTITDSGYSKIFFFDDINSKNHFLKHFLGGMFITIGMTGLDQDMMQKNLSCKNTKEAQWNMISMAAILIVVNLIFLGLGALLYTYAEQIGIAETKDLLFSSVAMSDEAGPVIGVLFLLGLIAAAYSSADSALTSLTTSFTVDFLNIKKYDSAKQVFLRKRVHVATSVVVILVVIILKYTTDSSAIGLLMQFAGFTYGPLIGMFFFGILMKRQIGDVMIPLVSVFSIFTTFILWYFSAGGPGHNEDGTGIFGMYVFGFELIILNAFITFFSLLLVSSIQILKPDHYETDS
jgi:Na+/proline symporter